jgi:hypothetical protein
LAFICEKTEKKPGDSDKKQGLYIIAWNNKNGVKLGLGCIHRQKR